MTIISKGVKEVNLDFLGDTEDTMKKECLPQTVQPKAFHLSMSWLHFQLTLYFLGFFFSRESQTSVSKNVNIFK